MKFKIRTKIVALGAILSILAAAIAITVSYFNFNRQTRNALRTSIDNSIAAAENDFGPDGTNSDYYLKSVYDMYQYINERIDPNEEDPEFDGFDEKKEYYMQKFPWIYGYSTGLGASQPMLDMKNKALEIESLLTDTRISSGAKSVYLGYFDYGRLIFIQDDRLNSNTSFCNLPGSYTYYDTSLEKNGKYYDFNYNDYLTRATEFSYVDENTGELLFSFFLFVEYDYVAADEEIKTTLLYEGITLAIVSLILILFYGLTANLLFVNNVNKLSDHSKKITKKIQNHENIEFEDVNIKSKDEIGTLASSIATLENEIINYVKIIKEEAAEKERIETELSVASKIQLDALPKYIFNDKNINFESYIKTAKEVGGDFYDYFYLDDNRIAVVISDVSGKGIPASLFMMKSKELIKSRLLINNNLEKAIFEVNNILCLNNEENLFVTSFIGIINIKDKTLTYVNAGHEKPYIIQNGKINKLDGISNFVLGGVENFKYKKEICKFDKNDVLFMFTDGLNESINKDEVEFGYDNIIKSLEKTCELPFNDRIKIIVDDLETFCGDMDSFDDVTMIFVKLNNGELVIKNNSKDYNFINEVTDKFNEKYDYLPKETISKIGIIIDEILNNYISYEIREDLEITVTFKIENDELVIVFENNGDKYDPLNVNKKYIDEYDDNLELGGFGMSLVSSMSDSLEYSYIGGKNILIVKKKISN